MAAVDPLFAKIDARNPGLYVWRVENKRAPDGTPLFGLAVWKDPGVFTNGDSFLILNLAKFGKSLNILQELFVWIGQRSTSDEYGVAVVKMKELGDFLKASVHHREVQGHESPKFHAAMAQVGGIRILSGDYPSGWNPVGPEASGVRLFKVKGARAPVVIEVPPTGKSLNQGDAFVLVVDHVGTTNDALYLWFGTSANPKEKMTAARLLDLYKGRLRGAKVVRFDNGETTPEFWAALGGPTPIAPAGRDDAEAEQANVKKLYKQEGSAWKQVAQGDAVKTASFTGSQNVFALHRGESVVIWLGRTAPEAARRAPFDLAADFIRGHGLPLHTSITIAREGVSSEELEVILI